MKRKLYLWNDLDLFINNSLESDVDSVWNKFISYIIANKGWKEVDYYCFNKTDTQAWIDNITISDEFVISIGTRPEVFLQRKGWERYERIKPIRKRKKDGFSNQITMVREELEILGRCCQEKKSTICIVEDVIVNGNTIKYILDEIERRNFHGKVILEVFFANKIICEQLINKYSFQVEFRVKEYMEGLPIQQSTLICLYDLLFNEITDGVKYYERMDLIDEFLPNKEDELLNLILDSMKQLTIN